MALVLALAPLLTGLVRKVKARLQRRRGASVFQPYRDLRRLLGKEVVLADNASWLFRVAPYLIFAVTWVAAALVPTFATGLMFSWSGDLIAIIALLGSARFLLALAGMDIGTSFGGIGVVAGGDDRLAGRTGDADDRRHAGADRRLDAALHHRPFHGFARGRPARVAGAGAGRRSSSSRWPRTRASRSTTRPPTWN